MLPRASAALEGGTAAMLTASGSAATFFAVFNIASCGDHIVSSSSIYGGSYNLFAVTMKRMGVDVTFVDPDSTPEELDAAFRPNTKLVFRRDDRKPGADRARHRKIRRRAPARRAADRG